jgi:hypothetical protein
MARKEKSSRKLDDMSVADHLAKGNGSWFFLLWAAIFVYDAILRFFGGEKYLGEFWFGLFMFLLAILFCPCYSAKMCHVLGIKRNKRQS